MLWMPPWACGFLDAKGFGEVMVGDFCRNPVGCGKVFLVDGCWWCNEWGGVFSYSL